MKTDNKTARSLYFDIAFIKVLHLPLKLKSGGARKSTA